MTAGTRTDEELRREGFAALIAALGVGDAIRFVQLYHPGTGDYTAERTQVFGEATSGELLRELEHLDAEPETTREPSAA